MLRNRVLAVQNPFYLRPPTIQLGGGTSIPEGLVFRGLRRQKGGSLLTSFLASIARQFLPAAKSVATKVLLPNARTAMKGILEDIGEGENFKSSFKKRSMGALRAMAKASSAQMGSGRRRRRLKASSTKGITNRRIGRRVLNLKHSVFD